MGNEEVKPKRYACFTTDQQEAYEKLAPRQRLYVDYRGQGNSKTDAYKMAGFGGKQMSQGAYLLERRSAVISELVECLQRQSKVKEFGDLNSELNQNIDALAAQDSAERILEVIENADVETARRIKFYRDVISGKVKTVKKMNRFNGKGILIETKVEEVSDVETKMKARKELDRILGLNQMPDLSQLQMGDITINIVDASKKEELADSRNTVELDVNDVQILDGEEVIVKRTDSEVVPDKKGE